MAERDIDVGRCSRKFCWREDIAPKGSGPNVLSERVSRIGVIYLAQHVRALDLRDSLGRVSPSGRDSLDAADRQPRNQKPPLPQLPHRAVAPKRSVRVCVVSMDKRNCFLRLSTSNDALSLIMSALRLSHSILDQYKQEA